MSETKNAETSPIERIVMCDMCEQNRKTDEIIIGPYGDICKSCVDHCVDVMLEYHNKPTYT